MEKIASDWMCQFAEWAHQAESLSQVGVAVRYGVTATQYTFDKTFRGEFEIKDNSFNSVVSVKVVDNIASEESIAEMDAFFLDKYREARVIFEDKKAAYEALEKAFRALDAASQEPIDLNIGEE